jgi:sarcosine oxidase subunit beta
MATLPTSASVVVIGGGVIGTSILFHLAEAGVRDAVLVERGALGAGSTSKAAGGVRAQFSDELNVRIAQRSLDAWEDFERRPGWEIDLKQVGYLFLLTREDDVATFERSIAIQRSVGVESELIDAAEAARLCPLAATGDVIAAAWSARDGHCTPEGAVQGYAFGARSLGAHIATGAEVVGIDASGVTLASGETLATDTVICAAGAWSGVVAGQAGVSLPVVPVKRQIIFTEPLDGLPRELPFTIDFSTSFYFHREGPGVLMGMSYSGERPGFSTEQTDDWLPDLREAMARRVPKLLDVGIQGGWGGLYEVTPDHNALIGEVEPDGARRPRFLYATGFSGHGFLQAPGVGEIVRDLVLGEEPFVDVSELSAVRFSSDRLRPEHNIV